MLKVNTDLKKIIKKILASILSLLLTLLGIELIGYFFLQRNTPSHKGPQKYLLRALYHSNRDFIQYNRDCARYDPDLTYTLRPGVCIFRNSEFFTKVEINSLGLRDDEASLRSPEVIVLGDSHAMGWGVAQDETFPQVIEAKTGTRVLNAAISSYGTAREIELLKRLDLRQVRYIVIQYCSNDWTENMYFCTHSNQLDVIPRTTYEWLVNDIGKAKSYWFGQYVVRALGVHLFRRFQKALPLGRETPYPTGPSPRAHDAKIEADYFLQILRHGNPRLRDIPIMVLEIDGYGARNNEFIEALAKRIQSGSLRITVQTLDLHGFLKPEHFYVVDDHLNKEGHLVVAELLTRNLGL
jgi:hypothetical protein